MGFQVLCFVHQLVSMQLPLCMMMVPAVEDFHLTAGCRPESFQIHWAFVAVAPEEEEVALA